MAGRGPAPKDPSKRVRRNRDAVATTTIRFERAEQPTLPDDIPWPEATERWWAMWADSALSEHFTITDWDFLLDTALLHADYWSGNLDRAGELRVRVAKFGATPEDRARLRIQFAEADDADQGRGNEKPTAAARYGTITPLSAVNE